MKFFFIALLVFFCLKSSCQFDSLRIDKNWLFGFSGASTYSISENKKKIEIIFSSRLGRLLNDKNEIGILINSTTISYSPLEDFFRFHELQTGLFYRRHIRTYFIGLDISTELGTFVSIFNQERTKAAETSIIIGPRVGRYFPLNKNALFETSISSLYNWKRHSQDGSFKRTSSSIRISIDFGIILMLFSNQTI